jgi:uncharacterized metal-binding protein YceD (DUF177 family)
MSKSEHHWSVPVAFDDVPEHGLHFALSADAVTREAIASLAGVNALPRLEAVFDVTRQGRGLRVSGEVSGTVAQTCVVTLDPLVNEVREDVDLAFAPPGASAESMVEAVIDPVEVDQPEILADGRVDLGRIATEFLVLGIDPYPRRPDAEFASPAIEPETHSPFAALAGLKKKDGEG